MKNAEWNWYHPCSGCNRGFLATEMNVVDGPIDPAKNRCCPDCGHYAVEALRAGREVSAAVWYKPWTWYATRWEGFAHQTPFPTESVGG